MTKRDARKLLRRLEAVRDALGRAEERIWAVDLKGLYYEDMGKAFRTLRDFHAHVVFLWLKLSPPEPKHAPRGRLQKLEPTAREQGRCQRNSRLQRGS
jgi:hypothetical protein